MDELDEQQRCMDRRILFEALTLLKTGTSVNESVAITHDCTVLFILKAGTGNSPQLWTCKAHMEDVPSDGDCGFHDLIFASRLT